MERVGWWWRGMFWKGGWKLGEDVIIVRKVC